MVNFIRCWCYTSQLREIRLCSLLAKNISLVNYGHLVPPLRESSMTLSSHKESGWIARVFLVDVSGFEEADFSAHQIWCEGLEYLAWCQLPADGVCQNADLFVP